MMYANDAVNALEAVFYSRFGLLPASRSCAILLRQYKISQASFAFSVRIQRVLQRLRLVVLAQRFWLTFVMRRRLVVAQRVITATTRHESTLFRSVHAVLHTLYY